jgi:hypothetical protein
MYTGATLAAHSPDLRTALLLPSDLPPGYTKVQLKVYPHFAVMFRISRNLFCGGNPSAPVRAADWKQGLIEGLSKHDPHFVKPSFFQACMIEFRSRSAAQALQRYNARSIHGALVKGQLSNLSIGRVGDTSLAATDQIGTEVEYLVVFRHAATDVSLLYSGQGVTPADVASAGQFAHAARVLNSRLPQN